MFLLGEIGNMRSILLALAMLAALSVTLTAPAAHATGVTIDHLTVTVTVDGQTSTFTIGVPVGSSGIDTIPVSSGVLTQIHAAFGTTTFVFPGSYTGTFTVDGINFTVTLQSTDTFTITFT
jgi:hypothetical protein